MFFSRAFANIFLAKFRRIGRFGVHNRRVMPFLVLIFALLLLPGAEIYLLFEWFGEAPGWALAYLALTAAAGLFLMRIARVGFGEMARRWAQTQSAGRVSPWAFVLFGKMWFVGLLLTFPGYITDFIALCVILAGLFAAPKGENNGDGIITAQATVIKEDNRGND